MSNKSKNNNFIINIKSIYILKQIFDKIKQRKFLELIRYNKIIQNRLNKDINDFIKEYSKIEIELIPKEKIYGEFINIYYDKTYYHIYFNNNKKEMKRNFISEDDYVRKIKIILDYEVKSLFTLFQDCECIKKINFIKFYRNNITNMSYMFNNCSALEEINFNEFKTENVINMSNMFDGCSSLIELDLSNFNTNNVSNMSFMFYECFSLKKINLINFNTNKVTNMSFMFRGCSALKELDISNFNINNVNFMRNMFYGCKSLEKLNLGNINADNKLLQTDDIFFGCNRLKKQEKGKAKKNYKKYKK